VDRDPADAPAAYTVLVDGTGFEDPSIAGRYDDYGSLGAYEVVLQTDGVIVPLPTRPEPEPQPQP
jgi:hypothetical protein